MHLHHFKVATVFKFSDGIEKSFEIFEKWKFAIILFWDNGEISYHWTKLFNFFPLETNFFVKNTKLSDRKKQSFEKFRNIDLLLNPVLLTAQFYNFLLKFGCCVD